MLRQASQRTKRYLVEMVKTTALQELVDFFHGFLAFCVDPSSLLSPLSKFLVFYTQMKKLQGIIRNKT